MIRFARSSRIRRGAYRVVLATAVLALGVGGTVIAADLVTGKDIKNRTIGIKDLNKKTIKKLKGKRGPQGEQGAPGQDGANGANGANGAPGADGLGAVFGSGTAFDNFLDRFLSVNDVGGAGSTDETRQTALSPNRALTAGEFAVRTAVAVPAGDSITLSLRVNGVDTAVGCTVPAGQTSCTDADSVAVPPRSGITIHQVHTITGESRTLGWSFTLD